MPHRPDRRGLKGSGARRAPGGVLSALAAAVALAASVQPGLAGADHRDPCHPSHSCPSDHHTYRWNGLSCTSYGDERLPTDTRAVVYAGRTYWCSGSGAATIGAGAGGGAAEACGVERWTVKTLQDRPSLLPVERTTIAALVRLPPPGSLPNARLAFERHVFQVTGTVVLVRGEADGDLHAVLVAGREHMIAEAPAPSCTAHAAPVLRDEMARARSAVRLCTRALVSGVAFFDFPHGQTGVAPNAIELHPILAFRCLE